MASKRLAKDEEYKGREQIGSSCDVMVGKECTGSVMEEGISNEAIATG